MRQFLGTAFEPVMRHAIQKPSELLQPRLQLPRATKGGQGAAVEHDR